MRKRILSVFCLLLTAALLIEGTLYVRAITVQELQEKNQQAQELINEIMGSVSSLSDQQDIIEEEISDMDAELINLYTVIDVLEDEIAEKETEIAEKETEIGQAQAEYEAAEAEAEAQYEAMKMRIKYMYEKGETSYVELLITSSGLGDMLNKAEYIEDLYEYDRKMLQTYQETAAKVAALKAQLEADKEILVADKASIESDKADLSNQQDYLNGILTQKKAESANYEAEIAAAQNQAAAFKKQIAANNKEIAKIQEEERKRLASQNAASTTVPSAGASNAASASTIASAQAVVANAGGSAAGKQIASYACQFIGNPYVAGGTSLTNGADCSGFIYRIYSDFGYKVARTSYQLREQGVGVSYGEAQPGDIVCYEGHVGMYIGGGLIVHASSARTGIKISNAQYKPILTVRRVVS